MSLKSLGVDYLDMFILRGPPSDPHSTTIEQATQYMKVSYMRAVHFWPHASSDKHRCLITVGSAHGCCRSSQSETAHACQRRGAEADCQTGGCRVPVTQIEPG